MKSAEFRKEFICVTHVPLCDVIFCRQYIFLYYERLYQALVFLYFENIVFRLIILHYLLSPHRVGLRN